jgi:hypothetical protein
MRRECDTVVVFVGDKRTGRGEADIETQEGAWSVDRLECGLRRLIENEMAVAVGRGVQWEDELPFLVGELDREGMAIRAEMDPGVPL